MIAAIIGVISVTVLIIAVIAFFGFLVALGEEFKH